MTEPVIHRGLEGVDRLRGTVIVIDVFRASNTIIALLDAGAQEVALVADLEQARALKRRQPWRLLLGERGGVAPEDFDGGNSPAAAPTIIRPGDAPILTTSAGTRAVARLTAARRVYYASFANAAAVAAVVAADGEERVTMLPMGLEAKQPAVEDDEAADWIAGLIEGRAGDFDEVRKRVLAGAGAGRLRRLGQHADLELCTELDSRPVVPVVRGADPPCAVLLGG